MKFGVQFTGAPVEILLRSDWTVEQGPASCPHTDCSP